MKKLLSIILTLALVASFTCSSFAGEEVSAVTEGIYNFLLNKENKDSMQAVIDDVYSANPANGEEWYVLSLRQSCPGEYNFDLYREALENYLEANTISSATSGLFEALILVSLESDSEYIQNTLKCNAGQLGLTSWIYTLLIINNGVECADFTAEDVIVTILNMQLEGGGWTISGDAADIDTTAMAIQALAPYAQENESVQEAVSKALCVLSERQLDNGGYLTWGYENPESPAQVLLALSSLGLDPLKDERFIKNGNTLLDAIKSYELDDGSYCHKIGGEFNKNATKQVLYCLTGYELSMEGKGSFFIFGELIQKDRSLIQSSEQKEEVKQSLNIKTILYIAAAAVLIVWLIVMASKGKKDIKSYLSAVLVMGVVAAGISFIKIESKEDYYSYKTTDDKTITTTISIYCNTVAGEKENIPDDGVILALETVEIPEGSSAYDQLDTACRIYEIKKGSTSGYINGIADLYEYDFGELSGWMYKINGEFAGTGCDDFTLSQGDYVEWVYTTNLGKDLDTEMK